MSMSKGDAAFIVIRAINNWVNDKDKKKELIALVMDWVSGGVDE